MNKRAITRRSAASIALGTGLILAPAKGALRATHGVELPFVFHNLESWAKMGGDGPADARGN